MAKAFGTWLRDYSGENTRLQRLSRRWQARLRTEYVRANAFHDATEVWGSLRQTEGDNPNLQRLVHLAYEVNRGRLRVTKSRFLSTAPAYRPDPDVPAWPPVWE